MRSASLVLAAFAALTIAEPAAAQVSATIHIGPIRIGGGDYRDYDDYYDYEYFDRYDRGYLQPIVVVVYQPNRFGRWQQTARYWRPITVYEFRGRYYQRPFRQARPVVIYSYRGGYFHAPRDRGWDSYRVRYERNDWQRWRDNERNEWRNDWRDPRRERPNGRDDRRDRIEDRFDRREDVRDRAEDRRDRAEDRRDRADGYTGPRDRIEDRRDRREDVRDRAEDLRDRAEDRRDARSGPAVAPRASAPERRAAPADNRARRRNG